MNDIITFAYNNNNTIRTTIEDGTPLFCAKDVANTLGYIDTNDAIARHCRGVAKHYPITDRLGRAQEARFITEGDLYRLVFGSHLPTAEKFEAWVVDEVLPSIRKHGMYATPATIEDMIANPDMAIKLLTTLKEERAARAKAEAEIEAQRPVAAPRHACWPVLLRQHPRRMTQEKGGDTVAGVAPFFFAPRPYAQTP